MAEGKKKQKKSPWWYKLGILVFGAVFCVSAFMAGRDYLASKKEAGAFDSLSKLAADYAEEKAPADLTESAGETTDQEKAAEWAELLKEAAGYAALKNENPDYVGWIRIPDTRIDYPVVDRESDPEYYLHRAFDGSKSFGGTPFLGEASVTEGHGGKAVDRASVARQLSEGFLGEASGVDTKCLIIYGHNMKNGSIFGTLDSYKKADYWKEHPIVRFYVDGEPRTYEVFAAVETQVLYEDEDGFRYYRYDGDISEEEYDELVTWLRGHSDYDTEIVPEYEDQILMLSTCSYHTKNGRFVVAARRVAEP